MPEGLLVIDASSVIGWLMPDEAASDLAVLALRFASSPSRYRPLDHIASSPTDALDDHA